MFAAATPPETARDRILETAMRLFYAHGIKATGIDRIIAEADVAKMSFYRHFPSKDDLVAAFLEERHKRWMAWFVAATSGKPSRGGTRLALAADALGVWFEDKGFRGCAFINACAETTDTSARERKIAVAHKNDLIARLAGLAEADGVTRPAQAAALAIVVVEGAIVRAQMTGDGAAAVAASRQLLNAIVHQGRP